jgi:hypothetical protein
MLAGSDTVRDSLETIRPGEVALIKVTSAVIPPATLTLPDWRCLHKPTTG